MSETPIRLRSNEHWGKRSGTVTKAGPIFPGRKGSNSHDEHQGPSGHKTRWNPARAQRRSFGKHGLQHARGARK